MTFVQHRGKKTERRLSNQVAEWITRDIVEAGEAAGSLIGHETDLMQRYHVSRATLREAIRQIEARGVAEMRRGSRGGLLVVGTPASIAANTVATYLEFSDITLGEQFEARFMLECLAAGLAARRVTPDQIAMMRAEIASWQHVDDPEMARDCHFKLRTMIAHASDNAFLVFAATALFKVTRDVSVLLTGTPSEVREYLDSQIRAKSRLVEAIAAGDEAEARMLVRTEQATVLSAKSIAPHLGTPLPDLLLMADEYLAMREEQKLGMTTALQLRRSIAALGWPCGKNIGTEADLRAQLGISRGLLREALMLLEVHGIIRFARGRMGGIIVGLPDPETAMDDVTTLFHSTVFPAEHIAEVSLHLDLLLVNRCLPRWESGQEGEPARTLPIDYSALIARLSHSSGNRALAVLSTILRNIGCKEALPAGDPAQIAGHLRDLEQAMFAGDAAMAQRHMRHIWSASL